MHSIPVVKLALASFNCDACLQGNWRPQWTAPGTGFLHAMFMHLTEARTCQRLTCQELGAMLETRLAMLAGQRQRAAAVQQAAAMAYARAAASTAAQVAAAVFA